MEAAADHALRAQAVGFAQHYREELCDLFNFDLDIVYLIRCARMLLK